MHVTLKVWLDFQGYLLLSTLKATSNHLRQKLVEIYILFILIFQKGKAFWDIPNWNTGQAIWDGGSI